MFTPNAIEAHRAPVPEEVPLPGEEPIPQEDPEPHPDPVITEPPVPVAGILGRPEHGS